MLKSQVADSIQDFVFFFSLNKTDLITQTESGRMETVITTTQKQTVDDTRTLPSMYSCCDKSKKKSLWMCDSSRLESTDTLKIKKSW